MVTPRTGQRMGDPAADDTKVGDIARDNIKAVVALEREAMDDASFSERVGHAISIFAGSLAFVAAQAILMAGWIGWNAIGPTALRFDPYPFGLLSFIVSFEGVLIATFVLIA